MFEQARGDGHDLSTIASVASFFVSRVDTEMDNRLEAIGTPQAMQLRGKAALANARLAYGAYQEVFGVGARWAALAEDGAKPQRPLWASTGVKNPKPGHHVRHRVGGAEHGEHHAGEDDGRGGRAW